MPPRTAPSRKRPTAVREDSVAHRRLLLDTHVFLWWQANDKRLGKEARELIATAPEVRFSSASAWEIAIKTGIGKLKLSNSLGIADALSANGFKVLNVEMPHVEALRRLPLLHRDPFDRMLVAQALAEGLAILTADPEFSLYDAPLINATR